MIGIQWLERADKEWLRRLIHHFAKPGAEFELHCWNEETEAIALAASIAKPKETDWQHGVYFEGTITEDVIPVLKTMMDGEDCTPFFDILIGGDLVCEHWGTEIYILKTTLEDAEFRCLIDEIADRASITEFVEENT